MRQTRIDKLILSNTACYFPDKTIWEGRLKLVREKGLEGIVDANMERWFTKGFRERTPQAMAKMREMFLATKVDGYCGCGEAIRDMDHRPLLAKITAPTLVIAGRHDPATPLEGNEFIKQHIPGAEIAVLDAAHIANLEQPQVYADTVLDFLFSKRSRSRSSVDLLPEHCSRFTLPAGRETRAAWFRSACGKTAQSATRRRKRALRQCCGSAGR